VSVDSINIKIDRILADLVDAVNMGA